MFYLYVILLVSGTNLPDSITRTPIGDLKTCMQVLEKVKIDVSRGNESESGFAAFCGQDIERFWGKTWWRDAVKSSEEGKK
jgi:hypothetical protein